MSSKTDQIKLANRARNTAVNDAAAGTPELLTADNIGTVLEALPLVIANAFEAFAGQLDSRAAGYDGKARGAATAAKLKYAATELRGVSISLRTDGVDDGGEFVPAEAVHAVMQPAPAPAEITPAVPVDQAPAPEPVILCGLTDPYGTQAEGREPDTCLLNSSHLQDASNHQGKYSRWPSRPDDEARFTLAQHGPESQQYAAALSALAGGYGTDKNATDPAPAADVDPAPPSIAIPEIFGPDSYAEAMLDIPAIFPPDHVSADVSQMRPFVLDEATALPHPRHRSVSQIETYNACGMKYRLRYRDGVSGPPAMFLVGGSAFARTVKLVSDRIPTLDHWNAEQAAGWQPDLAALWAYVLEDEIVKTEKGSGVGRTEWRASKQRNGTVEDATWWADAGLDMVRRYFAWHCDRLRDDWRIASGPHGSWMTEFELRYNVDGVEVKGYIDQVWLSPSRGVMEIVDEKSGSSTPADSFQLGLYANALAELGLTINGAPVTAANVTAGFYDARKGELKLTRTPVLERHPRTEIAYQVTTMDAAERAGVYLANTNTNYGGCSSCELRKACPIGARRV